MYIKAQVAVVFINIVLLFDEDVIHFNDTITSASPENSKRLLIGSIGEFGNVLTEYIILTQFTNGNSHFHRSTFKGEVSGQLFVRFLR
jgi:hypothetical protein